MAGTSLFPSDVSSRNGDDPIGSALTSIRRLVRVLRLNAQRTQAASGLSAAQLFVLQQLPKDGSLSLNELAVADADGSQLGRGCRRSTASAGVGESRRRLGGSTTGVGPDHGVGATHTLARARSADSRTHRRAQSAYVSGTHRAGALARPSERSARRGGRAGNHAFRGIRRAVSASPAQSGREETPVTRSLWKRGDRWRSSIAPSAAAARPRAAISRREAPSSFPSPDVRRYGNAASTRLGSTRRSIGRPWIQRE